MLYYLATEHILHHDDLGDYCTSGVLAVEDGKLVGGCLDVNPDVEATRKLTTILNGEGVSILHFEDVIEDFLASC